MDMMVEMFNLIINAFDNHAHTHDVCITDAIVKCLNKPFDYQGYRITV